MPSRSVTARLDEELLAWAESYAEERGVSRTKILEAGLRALRGDAVGGVPELEDAPAPAPAVGQKPEPDAPVDQWHQWAMERQRKLNEAKERGRR